MLDYRLLARHVEGLARQADFPVRGSDLADMAVWAESGFKSGPALYLNSDAPDDRDFHCHVCIGREGQLSVAANRFGGSLSEVQEQMSLYARAVRFAELLETLVKTGSPPAAEQRNPVFDPDQFETARRLRAFRDGWSMRQSWHEPDEQGVEAKVLGDHLDNAFGNAVFEDDTYSQEYVVRLSAEGEHVLDVNLANVLAVAAHAADLADHLKKGE